jgi:hypothetical protein
MELKHNAIRNKVAIITGSAVVWVDPMPCVSLKKGLN